MKKLLLSIALFLCASCATPYVARVDTTGSVSAGFDLSTFVAVAEGAGSFAIRAKGSGDPLYAVSLDAGTVYVARLEDPRYSVSVDIGEPLPIEARDLVRSVLTEEEISKLGITFVTQE